MRAEYTCERCGHRESLDRVIWQCPLCGSALSIEADYSSSAIERFDADDHTLWRYHEALPVTAPSHAFLGEGQTPLVRGVIDNVEVWFKVDGALPTGSFKDRGAAVFAQHLRTIGAKRLIVDSSGNAAAAMAGFSTAAGLNCTVFVPESASPGKLVQAQAYGANVVSISGTREAVAQAAQQAANEDPNAFYASHNWHPVFVEGVKTWALESWEQLGRKQPDFAFVPTGGGSALVGGWRGFSMLPGTPPRMVAAQPEACDPVAAALRNHRETIEPRMAGPTLAEGTKISNPSRPLQILRSIQESNGFGSSIPEFDLIETLLDLWKQGLYVEPTAALGAAACRQAIREGLVETGKIIVIHLTGNGLKSTDTNHELMRSLLDR